MPPIKHKQPFTLAKLRILIGHTFTLSVPNNNTKAAYNKNTSPG